MRNRGVSSPDRAHAVFGAIVVHGSMAFCKEDAKHVEIGQSIFGRRHVSFR